MNVPPAAGDGVVSLSAQLFVATTTEKKHCTWPLLVIIIQL